MNISMTAAADLRPAKVRSSRQRVSKLEDNFAFHWKYLFPELPMLSEHKFDDVRDYRLDFAHLESRVGVELQGGIQKKGIRKKGGHSSGSGITRDYQKNWTALVGGWIIFPLTDEMSRDTETLRGIAATIRKRMEVHRD